MGRLDQLREANHARKSSVDQLINYSPTEGPFRPLVLSIGAVGIHFTFAGEVVAALAGKGFEPPSEPVKNPRNAFLG